MCINQSLIQSPNDVKQRDSGMENYRKGGKMRVLLCSENVPPQVNGIARRIGHYDEGLRKLGCEVTLLQPEVGFDKVIPHTNPWNFTARMMILRPVHFFNLLSSRYDVVHAVMPLNLSGIWLIAAFKAMRMFGHKTSPALIISWHCNMVDYSVHHMRYEFMRYLCKVTLLLFASILPNISDRILTPTKITDPEVVQLWNGRAGVCYTGIQKEKFNPQNKHSKWGSMWTREKSTFLKETNCEFLIVCVGRLSKEKGVDELIEALPLMKGCALWLIGDGPSRSSFESLVKKLKIPARFLGYQSGEALHAAYSVADCFVCPSLTETFGQTVNEALASQVRVAMPRVPVFVEAYSDVVPKDAFWEPNDRRDMANSVMMQLERHRKKDAFGVPDLSKLKDWDDACEALLTEYTTARRDQNSNLSLTAMMILPVWYVLTIVMAMFVFYLSYVRTLVGGSVREYFCNYSIRVIRKVKHVKQERLKN